MRRQGERLKMESGPTRPYGHRILGSSAVTLRLPTHHETPAFYAIGAGGGLLPLHVLRGSVDCLGRLERLDPVVKVGHLWPYIVARFLG